jgi:hypothetical protein
MRRRLRRCSSARATKARPPRRHGASRCGWPGIALAGFDPLAAGPASTAAQPADPTAVQNRQDQKEAFLKGGSTETRNSGNLQMPASPYQVMAGTVIAGALVTGIKSDLPGDVIATVTEPVYDTATGKFLLIPQGSRILGKYNSQVSYGQSRVQVVWNRVILPDTSSLKLDNLAGTDPAGYAGLEDGVDWHWDRIFAGAALTTLLGVGAELAAPENRQDGNRIVIAGRDSAQDSINQVGQEMTRRNMNIQPTLTERPGLPVRIIVNRDLVLRPYQPLFFNGELRNEHDQEAAARAAAQDRERQADLRVPGQPESRPRPLRRAARAGVWRGGRCHDADPAHAGGVHGGGSGIQAHTGQERKSRPCVNRGGLDWCPRPESNRHALRRGIFLPLRLSPPPSQAAFVVWSTPSP